MKQTKYTNWFKNDEDRDVFIGRKISAINYNNKRIFVKVTNKKTILELIDLLNNEGFNPILEFHTLKTFDIILKDYLLIQIEKTMNIIRFIQNKEMWK